MTTIEQFEDTLKHSDDNRRILIYIMPALLVGFILMALIYPDADSEIAQQNMIKQNLTKKLHKNSIALLQRKIRANEQTAMALKDDIYHLNENITQIKNKLKELDFIFYDDLGFANNIEKTLKSSKDLNLTINFIKTVTPKKDKSNSLIKLIKKTEIDGDGGFSNIVSFIQFIEDLNTLHDFEKITIEIKEKKSELKKDEGNGGKIGAEKSKGDKFNIFFNFKIDQYGVKL